MATYVTSQPHSNTNPTSKYRVVKFADWVKAIDNGTPLVPESEHLTFEQASKRCGILNKEQ